MQENTNPLKQFFRQPVIYIRLPSQGKFWAPGTINMPPNNELPIYPMTAIDEVTSRTPDALFNGSATVKIIESCVPNIKDGWATPSVDLDTLLVAIRIATYGHTMEIDTRCPKCDNAQEYGLDLRTVLENIRPIDYSACLKTSGLEIYFEPMNYKEVNELGQVQFEDQKLVKLLQNAELSEEEKMTRLGSAFANIAKLTVRSIAESISSIRTPDAMVTETAHIEEWLNNCTRAVFNQVRDHAVDLKKSTELVPLNISCTACQTKFEQPFTLGMTNFFESNS